MITGAVGGLVAKIFARLTFAFNGVRALLSDLGTWGLAAYTQIGFCVGVLAYVAFKAVTTIVPLKTVSAEEFLKTSVDVGTFVDDLTDPNGALHTTWAQSLFLTTNGLILVFYVIFGFAACYMFRSSEHAPVAWLRDEEDAAR